MDNVIVALFEKLKLIGIIEKAYTSSNTFVIMTPHLLHDQIRKLVSNNGFIVILSLLAVLLSRLHAIVEFIMLPEICPVM